MNRERSGPWGVLVVHPSRRPEAQAAVSALGAHLERAAPGFLVWTLQSPQEPVLAHAVRAPRGALFWVVPLLLAPGAHYDLDVQALARAVEQAAPTLSVRVAPPLLQRPDFVEWLVAHLGAP